MAMFEDVLYRAKSVAVSAGKKTEELVELTKVYAKIGELRREIAALYEGLGRLTYDAQRSGEPIEKDLMEACVDQIDELEKALARAEERVMQVKNAVRCSACGACNANNAAYCNQCGEKLD